MQCRELSIIFLSGVVAGFINAMAAGGSFLNLAILMLFGLPAGVANGTNRIGVLLQNISAVWKFNELKLLKIKYALLVAIPAVIGSLVGSYLSLSIPDHTFKKIIAVLMVVVSFISVYSPKSIVKDKHFSSNQWVGIMFVFFIIGIYGGFIQAGVGFFIISASLWSGFDIIEANGIKVFVILIYTLFVLPVFIIHHEVEFLVGFVLGLGSVIGVQLGIRFEVRRGKKFVRFFVLAMLVIFALKLIFFG